MFVVSSKEICLIKNLSDYLTDLEERRCICL